MAQVHVSVVYGTNLSIVHGDFINGGRLLELRPSRRETEGVAIARAAWLENHGRKKEAERHLDSFLRQAS